MKMKKTYINPETVVVEVELQAMIANTIVQKVADDTTSSPSWQGELGKENEISSGSIWGEEE